MTVPGASPAHTEAHMESRREFLAGGGAALAWLALGARGAHAAKDQVVITGYGGNYQDAQRQAYFEPFARATGLKVIEVTGPEGAILKAQAERGRVEWDVVCFSTRRLASAVEAGLMEKLDLRLIRTADLFPEAVKEYGVATDFYSTGLAYSAAKYPGGRHPRSWAEFWDVKAVPGRRGLRAEAPFNIEFALLADGVPRDKLYPLDVERAYRKLDQIKPHITVWWKEIAQAVQLLVDGELDLCSVPQGRIADLVAKGRPLGVEFSGAGYDLDIWTIPKNAPNREGAHRFIDFASGAEPQKAFVERFPYGPTNRKVFAALSKERQALLPSAPGNFERTFRFDGDWWGPRLSKENERFKRWLLS